MEHYDAAPPPPPRIPGLSTLRLLGVGGRSAVWLVQCTAAAERTITWVGAGAPRRLALKIPLQAPRGAASLRSAQGELEAMLPLIHPHLVRPWGVLATAEGRTGLLLEPYTAGSLAQLLSSVGRLSPGQAVTALTPVAQALEHLHSRGAAHGDLSCANILLSPEGRPALGDLGDAAVLGMPNRWGSPEQDIADLAAVGWAALTGHEPGPSAARAPLQSLLPRAPEPLAALLEEALSPLSGCRPLAGEFAVELYACAAPEPLDLLPAIDDAALAEVPTRMASISQAGHSRRGWGLRNAVKRLWGPARKRTPTVVN
ncbi:protein kinase domain-containing protein [Nesterenkonia alkaliphila]|uniref:Protein kinase n=1 Tax=Nesterenkonia alkaliphila TaxID=1463631 RepID=A0A7K1UM23_9MICC|nr:protein kinase [Nesterenkonia alkaliphila]MVT27517.1 protein kinase [Nesterenkonia alkaliphila]GFZ80422.1 hypothetical protein GCM10011359_06000 [Nesterenkonia alkaliphila]